MEEETFQIRALRTIMILCIWLVSGLIGILIIPFLYPHHILLGIALGLCVLGAYEAECFVNAKT
jgi:hypothetical protein